MLCRNVNKTVLRIAPTTIFVTLSRNITLLIVKKFLERCSVFTGKGDFLLTLGEIYACASPASERYILKQHTKQTNFSNAAIVLEIFRDVYMHFSASRVTFKVRNALLFQPQHVIRDKVVARHGSFHMVAFSVQNAS
jgi:hypothetical protein